MMPNIPPALPPGLLAYRNTPIFDETTLPAALRKHHATKPEVWALIQVLEGRLRYCVPDWHYDTVLEPGQPGVVAPQVLHFVEPLGKMRMRVTFYALPG